MHNEVDESQIIECVSMPERKRMMYELAGAFVALPGGLGTLEEVTEIMSWRQLNYHAKAIVLFDAEFWEPFYAHIVSSVKKNFVSEQFLESICITSDVSTAVNFLLAYKGFAIDSSARWKERVE